MRADWDRARRARCQRRRVPHVEQESTNWVQRNPTAARALVFALGGIVIALVSPIGWFRVFGGIEAVVALLVAGVAFRAGPR
jgi:hypothetical protein